MVWPRWVDKLKQGRSKDQDEFPQDMQGYKNNQPFTGRTAADIFFASIFFHSPKHQTD